VISGIFIDRPRLAFVLSIVITLAGLIAITQIPVAQFPDIVPPQVSVSATYPGADAEVVETGAASTALVPLKARAERAPKMPLIRPDPSFVTQLIATAEQAPQTRNLRRLLHV